MNKASDEQQTPQWLFDILNGIFEFKLDAAASKKNHLCEKYYDLKTNGLLNSWAKSTWCNPPYSTGSILPFVRKARDEWKQLEHQSILLIPADVSTGWFLEAHQYCTSMFGINQRLKFNGVDNCARFASVLVIYGYSSVEDMDLKNSTQFKGMWLKERR